jgi:hypothetical protein
MKILSRILFITLLVISTNAGADTFSIELTPIYGYRNGGEFNDETNDRKHTIESSEMYGLILSWPPHYQGQAYEVYYSHQSSELTSVSLSLPDAPDTADIPLSISYLHVGGTTPLTDEKNFKAFLSGGLGFTYLSPDFSSLQSDLRASLSIGVGFKLPINERLALRLETRGFATLFNSNAALFCDGGCSLSVNGSLFLQGEVFAGLAFRF